MTLSKSTCLAMLDSMLSLARSTSRVCDIVDRAQICRRLGLLTDPSADATVAGIVSNILKLIQTLGNNSYHLYSVHKFSNSEGFSSGFKKLALCTTGKWCISSARNSSLRPQRY